MSTHPTEATPTPLIHPALQIQSRARTALLSTRAAAWDAGSRGSDKSEREERFASEVTAAVAELVTLALGIDKGETR